MAVQTSVSSGSYMHSKRTNRLCSQTCRFSSTIGRINAFERIIESSKRGRGAVAQTMHEGARAQGYAHSFAAAEPCPPGPGLSSRCRARLFPPPPPALLLLFKPAICDTRIDTQYFERARDEREWEGGHERVLEWRPGG